MSEFHLTCDVTTILTRANLFFWHTENERKCTPREGVQRVRMGVRAGVPDLIIATPSPECPQACAVAVELKMPGKKLSRAQKQVREKLLECGWVYFEIRSVDQMLSLVERLWPGRLKRSRDHVT
jgi:hypothetical protein